MKVKAHEIWKMSAIEREKKLADLREDLFKTKASNAMGGTMTDPSSIRQLRRSIARLMTVMHEFGEI